MNFQKDALHIACREAIVLIENAGRGTNRERDIVARLKEALNTDAGFAASATLSDQFQAFAEACTPERLNALEILLVTFDDSAQETATYSRLVDLLTDLRAARAKVEVGETAVGEEVTA